VRCPYPAQVTQPTERVPYQYCVGISTVLCRVPAHLQAQHAHLRNANRNATLAQQGSAEGQRCTWEGLGEGQLKAVYPIPVMRSRNPCSMKCSRRDMARPWGFAYWLSTGNAARNVTWQERARQSNISISCNALHNIQYSADRNQDHQPKSHSLYQIVSTVLYSLHQVTGTVLSSPGHWYCTLNTRSLVLYSSHQVTVGQGLPELHGLLQEEGVGVSRVALLQHGAEVPPPLLHGQTPGGNL